MAEQFDFVSEAIRIVEKARQNGLTLRVLGASAFRIHCPQHVHVHVSMGRDITDIDFAAYSKEGEKIEKLLMKDHFQSERQQASLTPGLFAGRHIYENPETGLHVDIFEDELNMCHVVNFRNRLHLDSPTITLADLALEKFQIVRINEKDIRDMLMLFAAHPVGDIEQETINAQAQLELTQAQQVVADEQAQIDLAKEIALAELYAAHPDYISLQIALANAQAIKETDKLIFTPDGVFPNLIFNGGAIPSFDVNAQP